MFVSRRTPATVARSPRVDLSLTLSPSAFCIDTTRPNPIYISKFKFGGKTYLLFELLGIWIKTFWRILACKKFISSEVTAKAPNSFVIRLELRKPRWPQSDFCLKWTGKLSTESLNIHAHTEGVLNIAMGCVNMRSLLYSRWVLSCFRCFGNNAYSNVELLVTTNEVPA